MSSRAYDYKLTLTGLASFNVGNTVIGLSSNTVAEIIDTSAFELKVKLANTYQQFVVGEALVSNTAILTSYNVFIDHSSNISGTTNVFALPTTYTEVDVTDSITVYVDGSPAPRDSYVIHSNNTIQFLPIETLNIINQNNSIIYSDVRTTKIFPDSNVSSLSIQVVTGNVEATSFVSANFEGTILTANSIIKEINDSPYIAEKNAINQSPIVKLYSIYYPGEWYPPNNAGNPSGSGEGFPWPYGFPIRYAEVLGDEYYNQNPTVYYGNTAYRTQAMESDSIQIDASGKIGEISLTVSNFDGAMSELVENKNILGFNSTRSTLALVNGEFVQNIDPRTVSSNIFFNSSVQQSRGENAAWDYESTISEGDTWTSLRADSRDLNGAVVDIFITYAKFLDYWPEHSSATSNISVVDYSWDISEAIFKTNLVVNAAGTDIAYDVDFKPDGTKMYVIFGVNRFIREYTLTTPWDITSAIAVQDFSIASPDLFQRNLFFKPDGTVFYTVGAITDTIYAYSLSTAWDISTATALNSLLVSSQDSSPRDIFFKPDGTKMYMLGNSSDSVYEYNLGTPWNITTASVVQNKSIQAVDTQPTDIFFKPDGTRMFISGDSSNSISEFELTVAWDISTANLIRSINFTSDEGFPSGMFFRDNGELLYVVMWQSRASITAYSMVRSSLDVRIPDIYRVGDLVTTDGTANVSTIYSIQDSTLTLSDADLPSLATGDNLYIINPDADSSAHVKHTFVLSSLDELDELVAKFSLTNWLQYFKNILPKRKFYSTTCPFVYKGEDCKYPASGTGTIIGSNPVVQANGFFTFGNASTENLTEDICSKTLTACKLRKNLVNFGGFPNVQ